MCLVGFSLEEKLLNKEEENHVLRQKMLSVTSLNHNHAGLQKSISEVDLFKFQFLVQVNWKSLWIIISNMHIT